MDGDGDAAGVAAGVLAGAPDESLLAGIEVSEALSDEACGTVAVDADF